MEDEERNIRAAFERLREADRKSGVSYSEIKTRADRQLQAESRRDESVLPAAPLAFPAPSGPRFGSTAWGPAGLLACAVAAVAFGWWAMGQTSNVDAERWPDTNWAAPSDVLLDLSQLPGTKLLGEYPIEKNGIAPDREDAARDDRRTERSWG